MEVPANFCFVPGLKPNVDVQEELQRTREEGFRVFKSPWPSKDWDYPTTAEEAAMPKAKVR